MGILLGLTNWWLVQSLYSSAGMGCSSTYASHTALCGLPSGSVRSLRAPRLASRIQYSKCLVHDSRNSRLYSRTRQVVYCAGPPSVFGQASSSFPAGVSKERTFTPPAAFASVNQEGYGFGSLQVRHFREHATCDAKFYCLNRCPLRRAKVRFMKEASALSLRAGG